LDVKVVKHHNYLPTSVFTISRLQLKSWPDTCTSDDQYPRGTKGQFQG